jgi:hypothetical protein
MGECPLEERSDPASHQGKSMPTEMAVSVRQVTRPPNGLTPLVIVGPTVPRSGYLRATDPARVPAQSPSQSQLGEGRNRYDAYVAAIDQSAHVNALSRERLF